MDTCKKSYVVMVCCQDSEGEIFARAALLSGQRDDLLGVNRGLTKRLDINGNQWAKN
ncbi:MAG: hypothetical protein ACXU9O_02710 [Gemmatimonadaceae bacterium]